MKKEKNNRKYTTGFKHIVIGIVALIVVFAFGSTALSAYIYSSYGYETTENEGNLADTSSNVNIDFRYAFLSNQQLDYDESSTKTAVTFTYNDTEYTFGTPSNDSSDDAPYDISTNSNSSTSTGSYSNTTAKNAYYALNAYLAEHTTFSAELVGYTAATEDTAFTTSAKANTENYITYTALDRTISGDTVKGYTGKLITIRVYTTITADEKVSNFGTNYYYGRFLVYTQDYSCSYSTKQLDTNVKKSMSVLEGYSLTNTYVAQTFASAMEGYTFYGLVDAELTNGIYVPSPTYSLETYNYGDEIYEDKHFYVIYTKSSTTESSITKAVNGAKSGETVNIYIGATGDNCNVSNDPTYVQALNNVGLGSTDENNTSTTIAADATVNLCLNNGSTAVTAVYNEEPYDAENNPTGYNRYVEPQSENRQYTVSLQSDLYINGTLVIGGTYGSGYSQGVQGNLNGRYVVLDLNGFDIHVSSTGSIKCYGMIIDSSTAAPGTVYLKGGNILTLLVMLDYKSFYHTYYCASGYICPFQLYLIPYLRCRVEFSYYYATTTDDEGNTTTTGKWGEIDSICRVHAENDLDLLGLVDLTGQAEDLEINLVGPKDGGFIFELDTPDEAHYDDAKVVYEYGALDGALNNATGDDLTMIENYSTYVRNILKFENCNITMGNITITIVVTVGATEDFNFPISSFFDISLYNTEFAFDMNLQFLPGSSFYADENSKIIFQTGTYTASNLMGSDYSYVGYPRMASISVLDRGINYFDPDTGKFVKGNSVDFTAEYSLFTELSADGKFDYTQEFSTNADEFFWDVEVLQKYLGPADVNIYGKVLFDINTISSSYSYIYPYRLAGEIGLIQENVGVCFTYNSVDYEMTYGGLINGDYDTTLSALLSTTFTGSAFSAYDAFTALSVAAYQANLPLYIQTYGYDLLPAEYPSFLVSSDSTADTDAEYVWSFYLTSWVFAADPTAARGYARPLVTGDGTAYVVDSTGMSSSDPYPNTHIGTFDFDTGIFTETSGTTATTYYFDVFNSVSAAAQAMLGTDYYYYDTSGTSNMTDYLWMGQTPTDILGQHVSGATYVPLYDLTLTECTVATEKDSAGPYITATLPTSATASGNTATKKYRYFGGIYCPDAEYVKTTLSTVLDNYGTSLSYIDSSLSTSYYKNLTTAVSNTTCISHIGRLSNHLLGIIFDTNTSYTVNLLGMLSTTIYRQGNTSNLAGEAVSLYYDESCNAYKIDADVTSDMFTLGFNLGNMIALLS